MWTYYILYIEMWYFKQRKSCCFLSSQNWIRNPSKQKCKLPAVFKINLSGITYYRLPAKIIWWHLFTSKTFRKVSLILRKAADALGFGAEFWWRGQTGSTTFPSGSPACSICWVIPFPSGPISAQKIYPAVPVCITMAALITPFS